MQITKSTLTFRKHAFCISQLLNNTFHHNTFLW